MCRFTQYCVVFDGTKRGDCSEWDINRVAVVGSRVWIAMSCVFGSTAAMKTDVGLPRTHRHVLKANQLKVLDVDVRLAADPEVRIGIILHWFVLHIL